MKLTFVPAPGAVSTTRPELVAEQLSQPGVDVAQADRVGLGLTRQHPAHQLGVAAGAVVLDR